MRPDRVDWTLLDQDKSPATSVCYHRNESSDFIYGVKLIEQPTEY
jgi:hypothetical protein